jgi:cellulase/cellobiase CelA1
VDSSWSGGFQSTVTVTAGSSPIKGWSVQWAFSNGEQLVQAWNATTTTTGSTVNARNVSWNGALAAGSSASFGYTGSGTPRAATLTCASS